MPIRSKIDEQYCWQGHANGIGNWGSSCRLRIFYPHPEQVIVVLTNRIADDEGTTVGNCAENLLPKIAKEFELDPLVTTWLWHCTYSNEPSSISQMALTINPNGARHVCFRHVSQEQIQSWIGVELE